MANVLTVKLSSQPASGVWNEKANISFEGDSVTVHLNGVMDVEQIQSASRQLLALGFRSFQLSGDDWGFEKQFAFAQGVYSPKGIPEVQYHSLSDEENKDLQNLIKISYWTRQQVNRTPEEMSPQVLAQDTADFIASFAPENVSFRTIEGEELLDHELVGIHGVGRGSVRPPVLLELDFCPDGWGDAAPIAALVGKGITFDSGGYSIKQSESMLHMKADMGGAATVAGALALAISRGLNKRVKLYLCCAENLISGHAYKLGDVLTYKNGLSVEIVNTDAEGRLVLADGLILASESGAELILDAATLTGAAVTALGEHYNAVFSFDKQLSDEILGFSKAENENHWPLPLEPFHAALAPSNYADTANSRPIKGGGPGGASNAAGFLSRFVAKGRRWAHFDLAACMLGSDSGYLSAGGTGKGIRTIARTLLEE
ncbi:aminopeptidase PepB [Pleionea sediminis]|uniref:aminopeptidase PepB n=1 Tax=Pleionea sediminis TaxID=2569479 RepID=UPI001186B3BE|nr:aminopeptidase PepB [Pleionea sediminis]